jgi:peptidoglycan-associated lipoprotein
MNSVPLARALTLSLILAASIVGCTRKPKSLTPIPGMGRSGMPNANPGDVAPGIGIGDDAANRKALAGELPGRESEGDYVLDREAFKEQTVYFDHDSSTVKASERAKVDAVAAQLKAKPTTHVKVEGHCDERGTPGYNLALGERRALSVREQLITAGVGPERVSTISYGEDRPAVQGSDEAAFAKNRRSEFILLTPKQ